MEHAKHYATHAEQQFSSMLNAVFICCLSCFMPWVPRLIFTRMKFGGEVSGLKNETSTVCVAALGCLDGLFCFNTLLDKCTSVGQLLISSTGIVTVPKLSYLG